MVDCEGEQRRGDAVGVAVTNSTISSVSLWLPQSRRSSMFCRAVTPWIICLVAVNEVFISKDVRFR